MAAYQYDFENDDFGDQIEAFHKKTEEAYTDSPGIVRGITNELVKSYGFKFKGDGSVEWSLGNIGKAWEENKLSVILDYGSLLFSPAKFGLTALKIGRDAMKAAEAASTLGRAVHAGEFAGTQLTTRTGKLFKAFGVSHDVAAATELHRAANVAGRGKLAEWTYTGLGATPEARQGFTELFAKYGGDAGDALTEAKAVSMEQGLARETLKQRAIGAIKAVRGKFGAEDGRFLQALESGEAAKKAAELFPNDPQALASIVATNGYRTSLQMRAHAMGQISFETLEKSVGKYMPTLRKEYETIKDIRRRLGFRGSRLEVQTAESVAEQAGESVAEAVTTELRHGLGEAATEGYKPGALRQIRGGAARFARKSESATAERLLSPEANISALAELDDQLTHLEYVNRVAGSTLAYDAERLGQDVSRIIESGDVAAAAAYGIDKAKLPELRRLMGALDEVGYKAAGERFAEQLGWRKLDSRLIQGTPSALLERLPNKPLEKWVHPAMAAELQDANSLLSKTGAGKLYSQAMSIFRTKSTAWNPSSYVRNALGAFMYHAVGGGGITVDKAALKAVLGKGEEGLFKAGLLRGVVGSGTGTEAFKTALHGLPLEAESALEGIEWLGNSKLVNLAKAGSAKAEGVYRGIDDVFKLSLFAKKARQFERAGMTLEKAQDLAAAHVAKFAPTFSSPSKFTKMVSQVVPFSGFTSEAIRVYKNLAMERPFHAAALGHLISGLGNVAASAAGMTGAEVENAKQFALPDNMKNGQALLLPFKIGGQPQFLDMSYVLPLATIGQTPVLQQMAAPWSNDLYNLTANPVIGAAAAAATGVDPFTKGKIAPRFTEEQLGVPVTDPTARQTVGLMEYVARQIAPTWAPPGWAATNMLEAARGTVDATTGQPKEASIGRAALGNFFGLKVLAADADNVLKDAASRSAEINEVRGNKWKTWKRALANGDISGMEEARRSLMADMIADGESIAGAHKKFLAGTKQHSQFGNLSTKRLKEMLDRIDATPGGRESAMRAELFRRYQSRRLTAKSGT